MNTGAYMCSVTSLFNTVICPSTSRLSLSVCTFHQPRNLHRRRDDGQQSRHMQTGVLELLCEVWVCRTGWLRAYSSSRDCIVSSTSDLYDTFIAPRLYQLLFFLHDMDITPDQTYVFDLDVRKSSFACRIA